MDSILERCPHVDRNAAFAAWDAAFRAHFDDYLAGHLSLDEFRTARIRSWVGALAVPVEVGAELEWFATYLLGYEQGWRAFDDVAAALAELTHLKLGVVTNGDGAQQRAKLTALKLYDRFDAIVISGEVSYGKPDPRIFHVAAQRLDVPPDRCLFVGDRKDIDTLGAISAGMRGVWLNRRGAAADRDVPSIATLATLAAHLVSLRDRG